MRIPFALLVLTFASGCGGKVWTPDPDAPDEPAAAAMAMSAPVGDEPASSPQEVQVVESLQRLEAIYANEAPRWDAAMKERAQLLTTADYPDADTALEIILESPHRFPGHPERDAQRHPVETLLFFGVEPNMSVIEMFPDGGYYTEILAPLLAKSGELRLPAYPDQGPPNFETYLGRSLALLLARSEILYAKVTTVAQGPGGQLSLGPADSADMVFAVRELHNWVRFGLWDAYVGEVVRVLKPGGVLAVVESRARPGRDATQAATEGYLPEAWVIEELEGAGLVLEDRSEVSANPNDTKDYERGVWTLPPYFALGERDRARYETIGESDRMTLKFRKPRTEVDAPAVTRGGS